MRLQSVPADMLVRRCHFNTDQACTRASAQTKRGLSDKRSYTRAHARHGRTRSCIDIALDTSGSHALRWAQVPPSRDSQVGADGAGTRVRMQAGM